MRATLQPTYCWPQMVADVTSAAQDCMHCATKEFDYVSKLALRYKSRRLSRWDLWLSVICGHYPNSGAGFNTAS